MGFMPFSLSYIILTPRHIRLPMENVPQPMRERASSVPGSSKHWSNRLSLKAKSLRSFRPFSPTSAAEAHLDETGVQK
ncbi:hypothetical protein Hypma_009100 [Hypsizygus marmoreus]|uniref:Uncharacterized protein n=1 Tax=Hypsizygus marmoreus TaxID=39966 RepID=A0A369JNA7_HYPMA|nr:hypothetical protein Hypma_009100 [Hypsizygus marmoreus]